MRQNTENFQHSVMGLRTKTIMTRTKKFLAKCNTSRFCCSKYLFRMNFHQATTKICECTYCVKGDVLRNCVFEHMVVEHNFDMNGKVNVLRGFLHFQHGGRIQAELGLNVVVDLHQVVALVAAHVVVDLVVFGLQLAG